MTAHSGIPPQELPWGHQSCLAQGCVPSLRVDVVVSIYHHEAIDSLEPSQLHSSSWKLLWLLLHLLHSSSSSSSSLSVQSCFSHCLLDIVPESICQ